MKTERGLYRRKRSPSWWICYTDKHGNTIRESTGVREKSLAREILAKKRALVAEGKHLSKPSKIAFSKLCDLYWESRGKHLRMKGLPSMLKYWKKLYGNSVVDGLKIPHSFASHLAPASRNRHIAQLKAAFNWAIDEGIIRSNPAARLKKARVVGRNRFLTLEEIARLLAACSGHIRHIVLFALHTGMRRGEIFDLKWFDVNLDSGMIFVHTSGKGDPKHVPINDTVRGILGKLSKRSQYVFTSPLKKGAKLTTVDNGFNAALKRAKIEDFVFHDLRHTFASHLVMSGVSLEVVGRVLGHSDLRMTQRYAHLAPEFKAREIAILDQVFSPHGQLKVVN